MITVSFKNGNEFKLGVKTSKGILDVEAASEKMKDAINVPKNVMELILKGKEAEIALSQLVEKSYSDNFLFREEESVEYGPCVPEPKKIIGIGLNYKKHADECNMPYPKTPVVFSKFHNALAAHKEAIALPENSTEVDYEGELAIVIGKTAKNINKAEALSVVYGYTVANDLTARDLQNKSSQWLLGKSVDSFCPIGPDLVSKEEIEDPNNLKIQTYVNEEVRQDSNTSDMIFNCEELISYLSGHFTLEPGDIILTGTPDGVILGYPESERVWLNDGDTVTIAIENLGRLTNSFIKL